MSPPAADDAPAEVTADTSRAYSIGAILGSYRLVQQIGAGGMGRVFVAEHIRLGRQVALKILRSELSGNSEAVKRFFAEARAVNRIKHENIIEISDFVEDPLGASFYIMELLHGIELRVLQNRAGVLPIPRALRIMLQVCRGVGAAHAAGVIHRDIKPDNIFLIEREGRSDFVKLLDFGVAKLTSATLDDASTFKTSAGMVVGTPDYMAPEQALGQAVDHRADIYSIGVILYELLVGRRPFVAKTAREVMVQHMVTPPPRASTVNPACALPPELEELILHCLRKDPHERPESIQDLERRLLDILSRCRPVPGSHGKRVHLRRPKTRSRRWPIVAGAALMLAIGVGLLAWSNGARRPVRSAGARVTTPAPKASPAPSSTAQAPTTRSTPPPGLAPRFTIEPPVATTAATEASPTTGTAGVAPAAAPPAGSHLRRAPSAPPRRKAGKIDRDSVWNPFE